MSIRAALDQLVLLQKALRIEDPRGLGVERVYKYAPDMNDALNDIPCWTNEITLVDEFKGAGVHEVRWINHMQFFAVKDPADFDDAIDVAQAFLEEFMTHLNAHVGLGHTVAFTKLRGGNPTTAILDRGGGIYFSGLDLFLDITELPGVDFTDSVLR